MATNCTFKYQSKGPDGRTGEISAVISLADVTVNTTPTTGLSGGSWNTATVTADLQSQIFVTAAQAASAGIPSGWYQKSGPTEFRMKNGDA